MEEEHAALLQNHTWDLVPHPARANVVSGKWVFHHKFKADGSRDRYKARWETKSNTSLFVFRRGTDTIYLLYVDDIVLTASSQQLLRRTIDALQQEFAMKDLGELHHFLVRSSQATQDATDFRSLAGTLQYLTFTQPDISYAVQQICLHMHDPREPHLAALKHILRYIRGTLHLGLHLRPSSKWDLMVYSDADWAGCPDTRKSTSGYAVFLGDNLVSWSSKRQNTVPRSNVEAEYRVVANAVAEASWLRQLLQELRSPPRRATRLL
ncbi:hypothetical protein U9M48_023800 [Paspalum notatum var. saurae]|uniref:Reverse transcriptase Ty1/copia-type domain-containing protein n=1 Tax=Paspalum notatum var. saurae TaxID=547442 RepID=A0AAQ3TM59_PASNO